MKLFKKPTKPRPNVIIEALKCSSALPHLRTKECSTDCPYYINEPIVFKGEKLDDGWCDFDRICIDAADCIEQLLEAKKELTARIFELEAVIECLEVTHDEADSTQSI